MTITIDSAIQLVAAKLLYVAGLKEKEGDLDYSHELFAKGIEVMFYYNSNGGINTTAQQQALEAKYIQWGKQVESDYNSVVLSGLPPMIPFNYNATETIAGIAKISTQTLVEDINASDDSTIVSPQKHWQGFRYALTQSWVWQLAQEFAAAPIFSSLTVSKYLKLDGSGNVTSQDIPAADIVVSSSRNFATNAQIASWTAKVSDYVWSVITAATTPLIVGGGYIMNRGTLITATLPATAAVGQRIYCVGQGAGFFSIAQNAGQSIQHGAATTTVGVGGSLTSTAATDLVELICITADTTFRVTNYIGTFTVV